VGQGDAKVFKKYSPMKLQMKREALERINNYANEERKVWLSCGAVRRGLGRVMAQFWAGSAMEVGCLVQKCFRIKRAVDVGA
jgi:hypothetical protein